MRLMQMQTSSFQTISGFERLLINDSVTSATSINLEYLGFTDHVTTAGTSANKITFASMINPVTADDDVISITVNGTNYEIALTDDTFDNDAAIAIATAVNTVVGGTAVAGTAASGALVLTAQDGYVVSAGEVDDDGASQIAGSVTGGLLLTKLAADSTVVLTATGDIVASLGTATGTTDVINVVANNDTNSASATDLDLGTLAVSGVETVNISADDNLKTLELLNILAGNTDPEDRVSLVLNADSAKVVNLTGSAGIDFDIVDSSAVTAINASALTGVLTVTADGKSTGTTVTGGSGNDVLIASGNSDVLLGGTGDDTITLTTLTSATGGDGSDEFVVQTAAGISNYSTITDLTAGDVIQLIDGSSGNSFTSTAIPYTGQMTFAEILDAAVAETTSGTNIVDSAWFQYDGNTYIVTETSTNGSSFVATDDVLVEITGLVDLSTAAFNATTGELIIA